jgi:hypothetical protein
MNTTSSVRMAHEYSASMESFERMTQIMRTEVSIQCSTRCNSIYDENDLHHALIALSIGNSYVESGMRRLALESSSMNVPSGSWLRDTVEKVPEEEMINRLKHALESTAASIGSFKLFNMPIMAAVDSHKIPRYDEKMERSFEEASMQMGHRRSKFIPTFSVLKMAEDANWPVSSREPSKKTKMS